MSESVETKESAEQAASGAPQTHEVVITVNKKAVTVEGPRVTGLQIKQAAVNQGVDIELDFSLAEVQEKGRVIVGDSDVVTVNKNSKFIATAPDDNS